jgi:hypothetical protein
VSAEKALWEGGLSIFSESGKFGSDSTTSTTYLPFSLRRYFGSGDLQLVVPIISVTTSGQVIIVNGTPNGRGRGAGGTSIATTRETHSGLGDILFKGRYYLVEEQGLVPMIDAVGEIKFPTASRSNNLGTGEFDEGASLEFTKTIAQRWVGLADVGYTHTGSPPDIDLNDQWHYSLGGGYYVIPKKLLGSLTFEEYRALVSGDSNPIEMLLDAQYRLTPRVRVDGGIEVGLTTSAPDYGINMGAHVKF